MPKQGQRAEVNTFIQGLITEASPLNFPPNASKEEENFELFRDGTRRRRKGLQLENGKKFRAVPTSEVTTGDDFSSPPAFSTYTWKAVGGDTNKNILVVQTGRKIHFFLLDQNSPITENYINTIDVVGSVKTEMMSYADIEGKLIVSSKGGPVIVVTITAANAITADYPSLKIRDFWGIEITQDTNIENDVNKHPAIPGGTQIQLIGQLRYNLYNQSWGIPRRIAGGTVMDPVDYYSADQLTYPSMAESVATGLGYKAVEATAQPYEQMYPNRYKESLGLAANVSRGYFIIDVFNRGNSRKSAWLNNISNYPPMHVYDNAFVFPQDKTDSGVGVVATYAGRVFFSGFSGKVTDGDQRSPILNNYVLFSQVVKNAQDISKCYQEGDPTSRDGADIVDTDGGFIKVAGASEILGLRVINNALIVLASNGIWSISGGSDYGFTATNYKVTKLSEYGCTSSGSIVSQGDAVVYWGEEGIYNVAPDQYGTIRVNSLSQTTIQTLYDNIPESSRKTVIGVYDALNKKVKWIYKQGPMFSIFANTKELVLDFALSNFTINTIKRLEANNLEVICPFAVNAYTELGYLVVGKNVKYWVGSDLGTSVDLYCGFSFAYYNNEKFLDWEEMDNVGVDAKAFMLTGSQIAADSAIHKQIPYVVMHFERTENVTDSDGIPSNQSSCLVRFYWDWSATTDSNKVTALQQAYKYRKALFALPLSDYDNGFDVITSKLKVRGRGRAFALYLETEPKKDCHVLGWNLTINGDPLA